MIERIDRRIDRVPALRNPWLGVVATMAFLLWPLHAGPTGGWLPTTLFAAGVLLLIAVVLRVRQLAAAEEHLAVREETWPPAVAFGLVVTLAGFGWAPPPVARARGKALAIHWAGPTAVGVLALVLLLLSA